MDTYKHSSDFETLAIKILEEYLGVQFDKDKTKTTQKTRDYGVDGFVFIENESSSKIRTIEAKLRSYNVTLALKDIATSIIFFILRHGDEHYIITNVFLTEGTKNTIKAINDNNVGRIFCIDGEKTKTILERILPNLNDKELVFAQELINDFPNLKKPKAKINRKIETKDSNILLYKSRKKYLNKAFEELNRKKWISLSGSLGIGKHLIAQKLLEKYIKNDYIIININAISNGLISDFCYEVTNKLFGGSINDFIAIIKEDNSLFCDLLNEEEIKNLNILYTIFNNKSITQESSIYLAKKYFLNLFNSFNKNYLIVIDNFDSVSSELFKLIAQLSVESNINFKFLVLTTTNSEFYVNFFNFEFKKVYYNIFAEINIKEFNSEESICHILSLNNLIKYNDAETIYKYIGGNPKLIEEFVKLNQNVLLTLKNITGFTDLNTYYNLEVKTSTQNDDVLYLFFLIFILGRLSLEDIMLYFAPEKKKYIENFVLTSPLLVCENDTLYFGSNYIKDIIEINLLNQKNKIRKINKTSIIKLSSLDSLNQIIYYYFSNNNKIINIYNKSKNYWNHKNNLEWKTKALNYICLYLKEKINIDDLRSIIDFCKFANMLFENCKDIKENLYSNVLRAFDDQINILENNFYNCNSKQKEQIAFVLFDYYIQKSYILNKMNSAKLLFDIENRIWFSFIDEYRKIKFIRLKALACKSLGNKFDFFNHISKLNIYNTPYAMFSYYANMAAQYYINNPQKAYELLSKCPFGDYENDDVQRLDLWIENDYAIVLFYLNKSKCSQNCANLILKKSIQLSYDENIARSYNIIAINELKNNNYKLAEENFYNAIKYSLYCNNDSILHFSTNYLNLCYNKEVESICYNYYKANADSLQKIFTDNGSSKRLLISLISFLDVLKEYHKSKFYELYALFSTAVDSYKEDGTELKINNKYFVLF